MFVIVQLRQVLGTFESRFEFLVIFDVGSKIRIALLDAGLHKSCICCLHTQEFKQANVLGSGEDILVRRLDPGLRPDRSACSIS